ncbi:MAG: methionine ABC transporter ATP-binding protein [Bacilli bacterium]|jgi:D-methionine transport system ATP-binding protein|nr:methionine ABC transporter ATP-binding protein [Bacilli bacterium]MCH4210546.1 methionine ABC transporter ATP-binding protein [Bacilli bacterium]MCH4277392.1 methionine ABC transporter ATP-binding protein [Bacilli bacterium]
MSLLRIEHLQKKFGDTLVLDDISLDIEKGDVYGILGLSGAGKSTLVRCINGLERPTSGGIYFKDQLISSNETKPDKKTREKIAMIFQGFGLLEQRNALDNVHLAYEVGDEKDPDKSKSRELLKKVGLEDKESSYPSELSGGQKQRVAIARTLALKPEVLLCDEATSALDAETSSQILALLKQLNQEIGLTIIIISHQMSVIEDISNKVAIIDQAKIVEQGYLSDVFLNPQTQIAKRLIYAGHVNTKLDDEKLIRLIFNGDVDSPIISNIVQEAGILVSIYYADTKVIEEKVYGQLILKLPSYKKDIDKLEKYLRLKKVTYKEVSKNELV